MQVGSLCLGNPPSSFTSSLFLSHSPPLVNFCRLHFTPDSKGNPSPPRSAPPPQADYQPAAGMWTPIPEGECFCLSCQCRGHCKCLIKPETVYSIRTVWGYLCSIYENVKCTLNLCFFENFRGHCVLVLFSALDMTSNKMSLEVGPKRQLGTI